GDLALIEAAEGRHAGVWPPGADHRRDLVTLLVLRYQFRAGQIGTRFSATGVFAVAESALRTETHFAIADLLGGIVLRRRRFRPRLRCRALGLRTRRARLRIRLAPRRWRQ